MSGAQRTRGQAQSPGHGRPLRGSGADGMSCGPNLLLLPHSASALPLLLLSQHGTNSSSEEAAPDRAQAPASASGSLQRNRASFRHFHKLRVPISWRIWDANGLVRKDKSGGNGLEIIRKNDPSNRQRSSSHSLHFSFSYSFSHLLRGPACSGAFHELTVLLIYINA